MDRNFFRRIELAFPVNDPKLARRIAREHLRDGTPVAGALTYRTDGQSLRDTGRGRPGKPLR
jgi:polyphosphate kinase